MRDLVSHVCALARCAQSQRRWDTGSRSGPRTAAYTSPGHPGLGARSHASTVSSICQQLQIYLLDLPNTGSAGNISPITDCPGMLRKRSSVNQAERAENILRKRLVMFVPSLYRRLNSRLTCGAASKVCRCGNPLPKNAFRTHCTSRPLVAIEPLRWAGLIWMFGCLDGLGCIWSTLRLNAYWSGTTSRTFGIQLLKGKNLLCTNNIYFLL